MARLVKGLWRQINPAVTYRAEKAIAHDPDDRKAWTRAPLATTLFTLMWQVVATCLILSLLLWALPGPLTSAQVVPVLAAGVPLVVLLGFSATMCELFVTLRAIRRREYARVLLSIERLSILRALDYAFDPRSRTGSPPRV